MHTFADSLRQENAMRATRRRIAVVLICVASAFTCEIALAEPLYRFGVPPWQRGQSVDDINTVDDLRGKRMGFVSEESTSGFVFPSAYLQSIGIDYKNDFRTYAFLGSHPRATDALVAGSVDAAATWDFNLNQAVPKHGDVFKVIFQTAIPNLLIATHPSLPGTVREAIKAALLSRRRDPQGVADGRLRRAAGELLRRDTQDRSQSVELSERQWRASACGPGYDLVG